MFAEFSGFVFHGGPAGNTHSPATTAAMIRATPIEPNLTRAPRLLRSIQDEDLRESRSKDDRQAPRLGKKLRNRFELQVRRDCERDRGGIS